jgi:hypothetical protein
LSFANNFFASSCDNLRPIIDIGTCLMVLLAFGESAFVQPGKGSTHPGVNG